MTCTAFAVAIGRSQSMASYYLLPLDSPKYKQPPLAVQKSIFLMTGGEVTPNDMAPILRWKRDLELAS